MFTENLLKTPQKNAFNYNLYSKWSKCNKKYPAYNQKSSAHWPNCNKPFPKNISTFVTMNTTYMIDRREVDGIRVSLRHIFQIFTHFI